MQVTFKLYRMFKVVNLNLRFYSSLLTIKEMVKMISKLRSLFSKHVCNFEIKHKSGHLTTVDGELEVADESQGECSNTADDSQTSKKEASGLPKDEDWYVFHRLFFSFARCQIELLDK